MHPVCSGDYHDIRTVSSPSISPDDKQIAYVQRVPNSSTGYETAIYTLDVHDRTNTRFTSSDTSASQPAWSPSGDQLAFVSTRGDTERPQLWIAPTDGGEAERVTTVPGGVGGITWSPDGSAIAFIQETKPREREHGHDLRMDPAFEEVAQDPRVITDMVYRLEGSYRPARSWEEYYDGARPHVYILDLENRRVSRVTEGETDHLVPAWGDDRTLYYLRHVGAEDSSEYEIRAYSLDDEATSTVRETVIRPNTVPALSATADGRLAYPYDDPSVELMPQTEIQVFDTTTEEVWTPTEPVDRKPTHSHPVQWSDDGESIYFMTDDEGGRTLLRVDATGGDAPEAVVEGVDINGAAIGTETVVFTQSEWDHPGDVFSKSLADPSGPDSFERLTRVNESYLAEREVLEPEEWWHENGEGDEIQGWILRPPEFDPTDTYPLIVQVHGGPSPVMWTTSGTMWHEFQSQAHAGYIVFWSNPRGSTGYGKEFMRAVRRDHGGPFYRDVMAGVDQLCEREYVDADNLFLTGGSYGGYMTAWTIGQTDRFAAASAQRGVYDFATTYGTGSHPSLREWYYGTLPWEEPELFWEHSPVAHAHKVSTPLQIIQSEHDYNCPRADAEMMHRYLTKNGVTSQLILYPREGHELSRSGEPDHVVDRLERIQGWFDTYSDYHEGGTEVDTNSGSDSR